jgi:hypothetical protein
MLLWGVGFSSPHTRFPEWQRHFGNAASVLAWLTLIAAGSATVYAWRELGLRRIAVYLVTFLLTALAIGLPGRIPHHAFPLVVLYAVAVVIALNAAADRMGRRFPGLLRTVGFATRITAVFAAQVVLGRQIYHDAITDGPQRPFLDAASELFYGTALAPVRAAHDPLLVFEDCLGAISDPLHYYARAATGSALIVHNLKDSSLQVAQSVATAAAAGRPVFEAFCTGRDDPWYHVIQVAG